MDNLPFFQEENKDLLYNLCKDEIYKEKQYNIDESRKYYKTFGEIMKIVYKHSSNKHDMVTLNKEVLAKTIPYLNQEIESKKLKSQPMLPPQVRQTQQAQSSQMLVNQSPQFNNTLPVSFRPDSTPIEQKQNGVSQDYEAMRNSRDAMFQKAKPAPVDFTVNSNDNLESAQNLYQKNLAERAEIDRQFDIGNKPQNLDSQFQTNINQGIDSNQAILQPTNPNSNSTPSPLVNQGQMATQDNKVVLPDGPPANMKVQDFEISDTLIQQLHQNTDQEANLKLDLNTYQEENNNVDPKVLMERMQQENQKQDEEFLKVQQSRDNFAEAQKEANFNLELGKQQQELDNQIQESKFQDSLTYKINEQMNAINVEELKGQLDKKSEEFNREDLPKANDIEAISTNDVYEENKLFAALKEKLFQERKYVNKENLVIINSADRDWFNTSHENRYNFQVRFNPDSDSKDCGIQNIFKNIVSFEIIRVLLPVENFKIPFDNRIFVDYKSLPYVVLKIDEIEGLYNGTNSNTNKAFAQLLWDKDQTAEVLNDTSLLFNGKTYARQLKRGFSSMAPMSFEKKTFYPTPLSSLNRLTISLETPYGSSIQNYPDTLSIKNINFVKTTSLVLDDIAADADRFRASETITGTAPIDLDLLNEYTNDRGLPAKVDFTFDDNSFDGKKFTVTGLDTNNDTITEDITGPATGSPPAVSTSNSFVKIIKITCNATPGSGNLEIGSQAVSDRTSSLELLPSPGFPNTDETKKYYVEIEINHGFQNRIFKIGDNIVIKGDPTTTFLKSITETNVDFKSFLERDSGHFIINLEKEFIGSNQGYITKMYIAPPGDFDTSAVTPAMVASSLSSQTADSINLVGATAKAKLINKSLQTHLTFKITTREEDIHSHMLSSNV